MARINKQDYYFGAALSRLLSRNNDSRPSLIERPDDGKSRTYNMITNTSDDFYIYMKYCSQETNRCSGARTWQFTFNDADREHIADCVSSGEKTYIVLICGTKDLNDGEVVILTQNEYAAISHKKSVTIRLDKNRKQVEVAEKGGAGLQIARNRPDGRLTDIEDCNGIGTVRRAGRRQED